MESEKWQKVKGSSGVKRQNVAGNSASSKPPPPANIAKQAAFSAYLMADDDEENVKPNDSGVSRGNGKKNQQKKTDNVAVFEKPPDPVKFDVKKLKDGVEACERNFPGNAFQIMQELCVFFKIEADFAGCVSSKLPGSSNPSDDLFYPLKYLTPQQLKSLRGILPELSMPDFRRFIEYCVEEMTNAFTKGQELPSLRLCLQLVALEKPQLFVELVDTFSASLKSSKTLSHRCSAILSVFSQAGVGSLSAGLSVWLTMTLYTINLPNLVGQAIAHAEKLLSAYSVLNDLQLPPSSEPQVVVKGYDFLSASLEACQPFSPPPHGDAIIEEVNVALPNFFRLVDLIFPVPSKGTAARQPSGLARLTPVQRRQITAIYMRMKPMLMKFGNVTRAATVFPSYLVRLTEGMNVSSRREILSTLFCCFEIDLPGCCQAWKSVCKSFPDNSQLLWEGITENASWYLPNVPDKKLLDKTIAEVRKLVADARKNGHVGNGVDIVMSTDAEFPFNEGGRSRLASFFSHVFVLLLLCLAADFCFANCQPKAMLSSSLITKYSGINDPYGRLFVDLNVGYRNYVVPTASKVVREVWPWIESAGKTIEPHFQAAKLWLLVNAGPHIEVAWKHMGSLYSNFKIYAVDLTNKTDSALISKGVDVRGIVHWLIHDILPAMYTRVTHGVNLAYQYVQVYLPVMGNVGL